MDEITEYILKSESKLTSANRLYEMEQYSDSVSLAYYSMFLAAKALVIKKGGNPKSHHGTITELENYG